MFEKNFLKIYLLFLFLTPKFWLFLFSKPLIIAFNIIFLFSLFLLKNFRGFRFFLAIFFYLSWIVFLHFGAFNRWLTQLYSQIPIIHSYINKCVADAPLWVCRIAYNKITFGFPHLVLSLLDVCSSETLFLKGPNISYLATTALFFYTGCFSILKNWPSEPPPAKAGGFSLFSRRNPVPNAPNKPFIPRLKSGAFWYWGNFYLMMGLALYPLNVFFLGRNFDLGFFLIPIVMTLGFRFFSELGGKNRKIRLFSSLWLGLVLLDFAKTLSNLYLIK